MRAVRAFLFHLHMLLQKMQALGEAWHCCYIPKDKAFRPIRNNTPYFNWQDIMRAQIPRDGANLAGRVFIMNWWTMVYYIVDKKIFGHIASFEGVVGFQKTGLPLAFCIFLLYLTSSSTNNFLQKVEILVYAEITYVRDRNFRELVWEYSIHTSSKPRQSL